MVRKLTKAYTEELDKINDNTLLVHYNNVWKNFVKCYDNYLSFTNGIETQRELELWGIIRDLRKKYIGILKEDLYDVSISPSQLHGKGGINSRVISNRLYVERQEKITLGEYNLETLSILMKRYYKPFCYDYIVQYRPHLLNKIS